MQRVLVAVLVALALLQPVRPQVGAQETEDNLSTSRGRDQPTVLNLDHYLLQLNSKLDTLNSKLDILDSKLDVHDTAFSQHKQQTAAELAQLQTSLIATQSALAATQSALAATQSTLTTTQSSLETVNSKLDMIDSGLSQHKQQTAADLAQLQTSLTTSESSQSSLAQQVNTKLSTLTTSLSQHKQQTVAELAQLQTSHTATQSALTATLSALAQLQTSHTATQSSLGELHTLFSQHKQQTEAELVHLHNTMTSISAQLASSAECMDTERSLELHQNLQNNLTHQLKDIQKDVTSILGPYTCGGTGGWRRVVYLDMTDPSTTCPSGWQLTGYSKRTCGRATDEPLTCDSVTFPVSGGEYSRVCGRIKAYQWGATLAFYTYLANYANTIDSAYIHGISVTHSSPRQHIWTFVAGRTESNPAWYLSVCPCDTSHTTHLPPFMGEDYFCESGVNEPWNDRIHYTLHSSDPLWDGENCLSSSTCCSLHNPPYFVKQLPTPTTDDIEARICQLYTSSAANIAVELIELYVQ